MPRFGPVRARSMVIAITWALLAVGAGATPSAAAGPGATMVAAGGTHTCALRTNGTVWCWGGAAYGQLGDGTAGDANAMRTAPVQVRRKGSTLKGVTSIAVGFLHSCALRADRTVWCWGNAQEGQLGNGDTAGTVAYYPFAVQVKRGSGELTNVKRIVAGGSHTCALRFDGSVLCWGRADLGQVGDGTTGDANGDRRAAVRVRHGSGYLRNVVAMAAGNGHTCATKANGSVYCWGDGSLGQLGDGASGSGHRRTKPARVRRGSGYLTNITRLHAEEYHTCARRADGTAWCWGLGEYGQLGDGTRGGSTGLRTKPVQVARSGGALTGVTSVGAGASHTCARRSDGSAWCWGLAFNGQLGDGTSGDPATNLRLRPVRVVRATGPFTGVRAVDGGDFHTCAVRTDRTVWCWGANQHGQLGRGSFDTDPHRYPRRVVFP